MATTKESDWVYLAHQTWSFQESFSGEPFWTPTPFRTSSQDVCLSGTDGQAAGRLTEHIVHGLSQGRQNGDRSQSQKYQYERVLDKILT
jgi:hypothetical protein